VSQPEDKDQRTQAPTGKRISDFRKRGEIPLSRELTMVATMAGGAIGFFLCSGSIVAAVKTGTAAGLAHIDGAIQPAFSGAASTYLTSVLPIVIGAVVGWAVATAPQLGWPPVFKWPTLNLPSLFNPGAIMGILSPKAALARIGQASAKVIAVGGVAALALALELRDFISVPALDAPTLAVRLGGAVARIFLYSGIVLAPLAIVDYIRAKRRIMARMRMTHAEVKREFREQEGDPTNKRRRRQRMRELAKRRVAQAVKGADVVLVNPTEYAVALRYDSDEDRAPRVLAKGRGEPAERIRELARQNGIPIVAEPPLTRMIYKLVPEGREIPAALYKAVAEVLAYVYRLRRRSS
jgi:flagellar biosynthesis protein FlhB